MAITDTTYYYFKMRGGKTYTIKATAIHINTDLMTMYRELTAEQQAFHLEHPTASVTEVWNCELTPPYVPPAPDLQEYISQKVKELKDACYGSVTVTSLEVAMALDKVANITASCYYDITAARQVLSDFRTQSKAAMQVFDTYRAQMEAAQSVESVDSIYEEAINNL